MGKIIAIVGTLDTKGDEIRLLKSFIEEKGHQTLVIDTGILGVPDLKADVPREDVSEAGGQPIEVLREKNEEAFAQKIMSLGLKEIVIRYLEAGRIHGFIAIGGGQGSIIASPTLKSLPFGFPKLLVSTKATQAGIRPYIGIKDVFVLPPVADLAGVNRFTRKILRNAAGAISGMVEMDTLREEGAGKPVVVMSMNGTITDCGLSVKNTLEGRGYEVIVFHSIGTGGEALEEYVKTESGIACVIELAVNEIGNELLGGLASSGPDRFNAAAERGIPQIIVPGSADFINFLAPDTVPEKFRGRKIHSHNPQATILRTNVEENRILGQTLAEKLNRSRGTVTILLPQKGLSSVDKFGKPFWDPEADRALFETLKGNLNPGIRIVPVNAHINDTIFAQKIIEVFDEMIQ